MNIDNSISGAIEGYNRYLYYCNLAAEEAQKYIDWDDFVSCEYIPNTGLSILATVPNDCNISGISECVCPIRSFFSSVKSKKAITTQEFKAISVYV